MRPRVLNVVASLCFCHKWFCKCKSVIEYFFLVLKIQLFSNNLDANKILVFFPLKASSNLLSEKPILSCLVVRCQTSLYFNFLLLKLKVNLVKELRHSLLHLFLHKVFPNVYLFIQITFLTSVQQKLQFSCME